MSEFFGSPVSQKMRPVGHPIGEPKSGGEPNTEKRLQSIDVVGFAGSPVPIGTTGEQSKQGPVCRFATLLEWRNRRTACAPGYSGKNSETQGQP